MPSQGHAPEAPALTARETAKSQAPLSPWAGLLLVVGAIIGTLLPMIALAWWLMAV